MDQSQQTIQRISNLIFQEPLGWQRSLQHYGWHQPKEYDPTLTNLSLSWGLTTGRKGGLINNLYADTENYKKSTDPETYHGNWARQTGIVIQRNYTKKYTRVTSLNPTIVPDGLQQMGNLNPMILQEFMEYSKISQSNEKTVVLTPFSLFPSLTINIIDGPTIFKQQERKMADPIKFEAMLEKLILMILKVEELFYEIVVEKS